MNFRTKSLFLLLAVLASTPVLAEHSHAIAMRGEPKYSKDFTHFNYANPDAPKGGTLRQAVISTSGFDSLNPFIPKGIPGAGVSYIYDSLTEQSRDEAFTEYGLVASAFAMPADRSSITFTINENARFHDGHPVDAQDVVFTFNILLEKGAPFYRYYYRDVKSVEALDKRQVKFTFKGNTNRELALIVGQMQVLPEHYWKDRDFTAATLDIPLGSGPYKITEVKPGHSITLERVEDYWARDLPVNKGRHNFDVLHFDYYRDSNVAVEAFKAGDFDVRYENTAKLWATAYKGQNFNNGSIIKDEIKHQNPSGMQGFVFNTRPERKVFTDPLVRKALSYAFDFETTNKQFMFDAYARTKSYFANSELASSGLPSPEELKLLEPFRDQLPPEVFNSVYEPPSTDGTGNNRSNLRTAVQLLKQAGWEVKNGKLSNNKTGEPFRFEILLNGPSLEKHTLPFVANLKRLGIDAEIRTLPDRQQYVERLRSFDFDMVISTFGQSLSPGNEQRDFWHSESASMQDSRNLAGVSHPAVDVLVEKIIHAGDRQELITATRALDRVLLWNYYVIPHWHIQKHRVAYWNKFSRPGTDPKYGFSYDTWWFDPTKAARLQ